MTHLILHKVRGKPAFDVAEPCCPGPRPCQPDCGRWDGERCSAENDWVIPTSGHRAYPFWDWPLEDLPLLGSTTAIPPDWPDHYSIDDKPAKQGSGLDLMSIIKMPPPKVKLVRRRI